MSSEPTYTIPPETAGDESEVSSIRLHFNAPVSVSNAYNCPPTVRWAVAVTYTMPPDTAGLDITEPSTGRLHFTKSGGATTSGDEPTCGELNLNIGQSVEEVRAAVVD